MRFHIETERGYGSITASGADSNARVIESIKCILDGVEHETAVYHEFGYRVKTRQVMREFLPSQSFYTDDENLDALRMRELARAYEEQAPDKVFGAQRILHLIGDMCEEDGGEPTTEFHFQHGGGEKTLLINERFDDVDFDAFFGWLCARMCGECGIDVDILFFIPIDYSRSKPHTLGDVEVKAVDASVDNPSDDALLGRIEGIVEGARRFEEFRRNLVEIADLIVGLR